MKSISLISVYNNKEKLQEMVHSAKKQKNVDVNFVLVDNTDYKFKSAAQALNYGVKRAVGEVFVFLHQDIEFLSEFALESIYDFAVDNKNVIFGAAGVKRRFTSKDNIGILTSMYAGPAKNKYNSLRYPTDCFTLDECLIACFRDCLKEIFFDEKTCDGWHLYGTDLCLQAQCRLQQARTNVRTGGVL